MDKYEYKIRSEEIKSLIAEGAYAEAAEIADTIDWRRVKSVMMLCTVSDLYKVNRRYEDAKNMLLLAYEKKPGGRTICYSLCELCIKTEEFVQAVNYYNEFTRVAPKDPERYILQYRLYEAQNVNLEERIGVLEELKKRDYREKWAYELAYLYHRVGLATRCVEECDELILWFGEGKYVIKAMELKMLHQPLSFSQQEAYDHRFDEYAEEGDAEYIEGSEEQDYGAQEAFEGQEQPLYEAFDNGEQEAAWEGREGEFLPEEMDIQVKTMDVSQYNTMNLQEELAAGLQEVLGADGGYGGDAHGESGEYFPDDNEMEGTEVFFGETGEIEEAELNAAAEACTEAAGFQGRAGTEAARVYAFPGGGSGGAVDRSGFRNAGQAGGGNRTDATEAAGEKVNTEEPVYEEAGNIGRQTSAGDGEAVPEQSAGPAESAGAAAEDTSAAVMDQMRKEAAGEQEQPPKELEDVLLQETDGQIRMVLPERTAVERQITGQMKIDDILAEWERMKKANEEKCREEVRQHVLRQTGPMFTEFEAAVRDGLLEQLEGVSQKNPSAGGVKGAAAAAGAMAAMQAAKAPVQSVNGFGDTGTESGYREGGKADCAEGQEYEKRADAQNGPDDREKVPEQDVPDSTGELKWNEGQGVPDYIGEAEWNEEQAAPEYAEVPEWNEGQNATEYAGEAEWNEGQGVPDYIGEAEWNEGQGVPDYIGEAEWNEGQGVPDYIGEPEWNEEQSAPDYAGEPEWSEGQDVPEYAEVPEWSEGQDATEYAGEAEWNEGQDVPDYIGEPEWSEGQDATDYTGEPEWTDDQTGTEYAEEEPWEEAVYEESPGWADGENMQEPAYEEAAGWPGDENDLNYEEAGYGENGIPEGDSRNDPAYAEVLEYEEDDIPDGMEKDIPDKAEYAGKSKEEASDALDYLDALEHVEEEEAQEEDVPLDPEGFEMIGSEEAWEEGAARETKKADDFKEDGGRQKEKHLVQEREKAKIRSLTREEKELFAPFIQNRQSREQLVKAIDGISMAAYTGNVVITGEEGMDTLTLAKNMIREVRMTDSNFSGKVAKITGAGLNRKNVREILEGLNNGALIIQKASGMDSETAGMLHVALQQEKFGIVVIMEDTKKAIQKLFLGTPQLFGDFTARVDLEALSNDTLVSFGRRYAREKEYSIDDLGMLALHTRIEESQTIDHVVTVIEVKQIVDEAIRHANRKTIGHFFDILLARRYDDEDMIILTEKDFVA